MNLTKNAEWSPRSQWSDYFDQQHVRYAFYSAANATALQQARRDTAEDSETSFSSEESAFSETSDDPSEKKITSSIVHDDGGTDDDLYFSADEDRDDQDLRAKILSVVELEEMFLKMAPDLSGKYIR